MKICVVAGARPNFMKIAPIVTAINKYNQLSNRQINYFIVHTGQHYDRDMSKIFFDELDIPKPDIYLGVGSGSHAEQTAEIMKRFEPVLKRERPDVVIVVGDVNSTVACSLVASKIEYSITQSTNQPNQRRRPLVAHVEAGLRSFDRSMPEEINRVLTDAISDLLFTTEKSAHENLRREGIPEEKIHFVGNVMIDTLLKHKEQAQKSHILYTLGLIKNYSTDNSQLITDYCVLTLHRPSNVDNKETFIGIIEALNEISNEIPIVFPVHPRSLNRSRNFNFEKNFNWTLYKSITSKNPINASNPTNSSNSINPINAINLIPPLGYLDFLKLMSSARLVLTDSGGIQEETTILRIPCVTIRDNTERPATVTHGTNRVVGRKREGIIKGSLEAMKDGYSEFHTPPLWDGKAAKRIVNILSKSVQKEK